MTHRVTRNQALDALKLLAAFFVVVLHTIHGGTVQQLPDDWAAHIRLLARWAVPFFFIVSGYFCALQKDRERRYADRSALRILGLYLLWNLIYLPRWIAVMQTHHQSLGDLSLPYLAITGFEYHLWFLPSLALALMFRRLTADRLPEMAIAMVCILLVTGDLFTDSYNVLGLRMSPDYPRLFISIPFFCVGVYFARHGFFSVRTSLALLATGIVLQEIEAGFLSSYLSYPAYQHQFLIGTFPFAIGIASLGLGDWAPLRRRKLAELGWQHSLAIYLAHPLLIWLINSEVKRLAPQVHLSAAYVLALPFVIFVICLLALGRFRRWTPRWFSILTLTPAPPDTPTDIRVRKADAGNA